MPLQDDVLLIAVLAEMFDLFSESVYGVLVLLAQIGFGRLVLDVDELEVFLQLARLGVILALQLALLDCI